MFADGRAGLAFALQFSTADITTTVDGTIVARAQDGYTVKIEIDPLAAPGEVGYVDYDNDQIYVGNTALVTEDTITYTNRRGTSIGGLVDGREYYVIALDDGWIKLAETGAQALRAGLGEEYHSGNVVNLRTAGLPTPDNNRKGFGAGDVDAAASTITLRRDDPVFNTFELGQAVVYKAGPGGAVPGLTDGNTYYIVATTGQNNLQGDSRFAEQQVVQLAESENEARAGVFIDLGAPSGDGHQLIGKHVLDSGFATGIGVVAELSSESKAAANAGLKSADDPNEKKSLWGRFTELKDTNLADTLFQGLTKEYRDNAGKSQSGASGSLSVAGALAFSYLDQNVRSDVSSTAELKSNEDLEVKATIAQSFNLGAESSTEPQQDDDGNATGSQRPQ